MKELPITHPEEGLFFVTTSKGEHMYGSINDYESQIKKLKEALAFYADPSHWLPATFADTPLGRPFLGSTLINQDHGKKAREALEGK